MTPAPEDPWQGIDAPHDANQIAGRRADPDLIWDCFWCRDSKGRKAWALSSDPTSLIDITLPSLRGIDISLGRPYHGAQQLILALKEEESADLFRQFCSDLMEAAGGATTQAEGVRRVVARTWRWHHLMRGQGQRTLSEAEQIGLLAELHALERISDLGIDLRDCVSAWLGPLDAPKDFELMRTGIEVKGHRTGSTPVVWISSEFQLDTTDLDSLLLMVFPVEPVAHETLGETVSERATALQAKVAASAPEALERYESLLEAAGLRLSDEYSERWIVSEPDIYAVEAGFPSITTDDLQVGIRQVRYGLELGALSSFRCERLAVAGRTGNGNGSGTG